MSEELRNLLRSADFQRNSPRPNRGEGFDHQHEYLENPGSRISREGTVRTSMSSVRSHGNNQEQLEELASLIGSIDADLPAAVLPKRYSKGGGNAGRGSVGSALSGADQSSTPVGDEAVPMSSAADDSMSQYSTGSPLDNRWKDTSFNVDDSFDSQSIQSLRSGSITGYAGKRPTGKQANGVQDTEDFTVIRFGAQCMLRGKQGLYLTATCSSTDASAGDGMQYSGTVYENPMAPNVSVKGGSNAKLFVLGVDGQGVGNRMDCICLVNSEHKEDTGPIRYGMIVSLKAPAANERLLGLRDGSRLGFWRNLLGQGEKWQILKAAESGFAPTSVGTSTVGVGGMVGGASLRGGVIRGCEDISSRGKYVRVGDAILIQTFKSDHLLSLYEGINGAEAKLVYRDRAGLGAELWRIEQFDSVPLPDWYMNRPYLNGQHLILPPSAKAPPSDVQARAFPTSRSAVSSEKKDATGNNFLTADRENTPNNRYNETEKQPSITPLNELSIATQECVLIRDLLSVLSGVDGQYIRIAFSGNKSFGSNSNTRVTSSKGTNTEAPRLVDASLVIDMDSADRSTASQVAQLLPICESAFRIKEFITYQSRYEFGLVSHALCSAIKRVVREFDVLVAQLEHLHSVKKALSLQKMVYLLQPARAILNVLERLCRRVRNTSGGQLLDIMHACLLEQGDNKSRELYTQLVRSAAEPFLQSLSTWIFRGELNDSYNEFMIQEDSTLTKQALEEDFNAQYWDLRYTLCDKHVPSMLRGYAVKALTAGKYLNVVRDCGGGDLVRALKELHAKNLAAASLMSEGSTFKRQSNDADDSSLIELPSMQKLELSLEASDSRLAFAIDEAYQLSSRALLRVLESRGLRSHLQSLRRFFLLEHGDFFTQFMDTAERELTRDVKEVALPRIKALLQMAVQTSTLLHDPNRDDLSCSLASHNLIQHLHLIQSAGEDHSDETTAGIGIGIQQQGLKGVEAFTLEYRVGWPLSIVLSRRAVIKYQLLSRLLYFSKHVERRVLSSWMGHQHTKELNVRAALGTSYCLRHRMLHFLQNFVYYMTLEVIGPRGHELEQELREVRDLDALIDLHEKFLDSCLKECLLASQELLKVLTKLMTTCLLFADQMQRFSPEHLNSGRHEDNKNNDDDLFEDEVRDKQRHRLRRKKPISELSSSMQERQFRMQASTEFIHRETGHDSFARILQKFSETFDEQLKDFLDKLWANSHRHHVQLTNLCVRLDYNGFYSSQFADSVYD